MVEFVVAIVVAFVVAIVVATLEIRVVLTRSHTCVGSHIRTVVFKSAS